MKATVSIILLAAALSIPLAAQTLTEQLQKGIYTEEVLGNRDEAVRIYRQIIAAPAVPRAIAQDAERRLARLTATKQAPVEGIARPVFGGPVILMAEGKPRGTVEERRYRNVSSGITFDLPAGWTAGDTYPSSDGGEGVTLTEESTGRMINVWMVTRSTLAERLEEAVAFAPVEKVRQRHSGYAIPGMLDARTYTIPQETIQPTQINGRHAIVAVGSYRGIPPERFMYQGPLGPSPATEPMHEYMTWIITTQARAFFYARVPVGDLPQLRPPFEQLVYSAVIP